MANAVFVAKRLSNYDDAPEERYHFPKRYLSRVKETIGDWVLYYESRRDGGRMVYFAAAKVERVEPDPADSDSFYAYVSSYMDFSAPVGFKTAGGSILETSLLNPDGSVNSGRGINAVRIITAQEFRSIFQLGVANSELAGDAASPLDVLTGEAPNNDEIVERNSALVSRVIRDAAFTQNVRRAYAGTCAFTGLKIIDTHGRYEVEAAHIRGVSFSGPDSIRNGIALSRTMHWMFDRGAFSIDDDGKILIADKLVPSRIKSMLMPDGYIKFPTEGQMAPHKSFLRFHREKIFAG